MKYFCCEDRRRNALKLHPVLNGIDFLEVSDDPLDPVADRQRTLLVHFLKDVEADAISAGQIRIEGGERIRNIKVVSVSGGVSMSPPFLQSPPGSADLLVVEVSAAGDFSTYTLRLVADPGHPELGAPPGFDRLLSAVDFTFKAGCPSELDCRTPKLCPPPVRSAPEIDYLAKDYASFRQLLLDRLAVLKPDWTERNVADLGIALVELLAYAGDYLSYQQDAVATEAYLATARRRTSVRRHARLVDYFVHEGSTSRVWLQALPTRPVTLLKSSSGSTAKVATRVRDVPPTLSTASPDYAKVLAAAPEIFELVNEVTLFPEHTRLPFYTWGAQACCLPRGAIRATLRGAFPNLAQNLASKEAVVLVLAEVAGPQTGDPDDADPARRHAVRLTRATVTDDPLGGRFEDDTSDDPVAVTEIEWHVDDALPFPLCVSSSIGTRIIDDVSVAWGNIVLADFGTTVVNEPLPVVPDADPVLAKATGESGDRCRVSPSALPAPRYRPALLRGPVTQVAVGPALSHDADGDRYTYGLSDPRTSARAVTRTSERSLPSIRLRESAGTDEWHPLPDLLSSGSTDKRFVLECEDDGAYLRFGDDRFGARPGSGTELYATYRVGNGAPGNVGASTLVHLISDQPEVVGGAIARVWNPLPARGGVDPESLERVRQRAPVVFREVAERAVTPKDYAARVEIVRTDVQKAAATFRWTGSWRTVFLTVDRRAGLDVDREFRDDLRASLERFRMAGHDLDVSSPVFVPLELDITVCLLPDYMRSEVQRALLGVFNSGIAPDGRKGLFHADNFTFGQPIYLSQFYAAAQAVDGVDRVEVTKFQRVDRPGSTGIATGRLDMGRLEIARLDNDPNFRDRGVFALSVRGGR